LIRNTQFDGFFSFNAKIGESSADPLHSLKDGFIHLWSEQWADHRQKLNEENLFRIKKIRIIYKSEIIPSFWNS